METRLDCVDCVIDCGSVVVRSLSRRETSLERYLDVSGDGSCVDKGCAPESCGLRRSYNGSAIAMTDLGRVVFCSLVSRTRH